MKTKYESERTAALIEEAIAVLERLENAPKSPLMAFLPTKVRRVARRTAKQLRKGQLLPGHPNVHTPDKLATYLEDASKRDEIVERAGPELLRIGREIRRVAAEEGQAAVNTFNAIFNEGRSGRRSTAPTANPGNATSA